MPQDMPPAGGYDAVQYKVCFLGGFFFLFLLGEDFLFIDWLEEGGVGWGRWMIWTRRTNEKRKAKRRHEEATTENDNRDTDTYNKRKG